MFIKPLNYNMKYMHMEIRGKSIINNYYLNIVIVTMQLICVNQL